MPLAVPTLVVADGADGGAFTATVAAGDASATNTLYRSQLNGTVGSMGQTSAGSRTGNGTITSTANVGFYVWQVKSVLGSETVYSAPYYQRVSDSEDSLHEQLQQAVLARILALSLAGIGTKVKRMKYPPEGRFGNLALPSCLLLTFDQQEDFLDSRSTNASDDTAFPVLVAFLANQGSADDTDGQITLWREQVRRAFRAQRLDVGRHYTTEFSPGPVVAVAAEGEKIQASTMTLKLICREPRGVGA